MSYLLRGAEFDCRTYISAACAMQYLLLLEHLAKKKAMVGFRSV